MLYFISLVPQQRDKPTSVLLFHFFFFFFFSSCSTIKTHHHLWLQQGGNCCLPGFQWRALQWFGDLSFFWGTVWFRKIASHSKHKTDYHSLTACSQTGAYLFFWTKGNNVYATDMQLMWLFHEFTSASLSIWKTTKRTMMRKNKCDANILKSLNFHWQNRIRVRNWVLTLKRLQANHFNPPPPPDYNMIYINTFFNRRTKCKCLSLDMELDKIGLINHK